MGGLLVLLLLILISSLPLILVYIWFRISNVALSLPRFLGALLAGAAAVFPALLLLNLCSRLGEIFPVLSGKGNFLAAIFFPIAFTEELSRLLVSLILFGVLNFFDGKNIGKSSKEGISSVSGGVDLGKNADTLGLITGFGFAIIESASYGASDFGVALLRAFTSAPLHGACGSRIGTAAILLKKQPLAALLRFLTAVAIHGMYNFMIIRSGFPAILAILIAFSALGSSIMSIRNDLRKEMPPPLTKF